MAEPVSPRYAAYLAWPFWFGGHPIPVVIGYCDGENPAVYEIQRKDIKDPRAEEMLQELIDRALQQRSAPSECGWPVSRMVATLRRAAQIIPSLGLEVETSPLTEERMEWERAEEAEFARKMTPGFTW